MVKILKKKPNQITIGKYFDKIGACNTVDQIMYCKIFKNINDSRLSTKISVEEIL